MQYVFTAPYKIGQINFALLWVHRREIRQGKPTWYGEWDDRENKNHEQYRRTILDIKDCVSKKQTETFKEKFWILEQNKRQPN